MPGLRLVAASVLLLVSSARAAEPRILPLEDALRALDVQSLTLRQARSRIVEASGLSRQALAPLLPTLTASAGYTRNSDAAQVSLPVIPGVTAGGQLVIQPQDALAAAGTLRVPLVAPSAWAEASAARKVEEGAEATADAVRLELRRTLVQVAWAGLAGEETVAATERAVASAEEQARSAQRALDAGTGVPLSVLQAKTEAVKRRSDLVRVGAELERARLAAAVLLGGLEPVRIVVPRDGSGTADPRVLAEEATARRPELRAAAAQVLAAERQLTAAHLRWLPQLSASGSAFAQDVPFPTGKKDGWRVTLDLVWPLYDGGARYGRARQARGAIEGSRAAEAAERIAIVQEVTDATRDVHVAQERLLLAEQQASLAGEAAATARRGFAGGVASSLDVLDANDRLYQSEVGLANARARLGMALATLDRAVGRS